MAIRLMNYLSRHSILTSFQYGFRPNFFFTDFAFHHLRQNVYNAPDNKMFQLTVFYDFIKAFDTLFRNILLQKLSVYGIRVSNVIN